MLYKIAVLWKHLCEAIDVEMGSSSAIKTRPIVKILID